MSTPYCPKCGVIIPSTNTPGNVSCQKCSWEGHITQTLKEPLLFEPIPAIKYVSIDIETTGLNPDTCQVLEIGAIIEDWTRPLAQLSTFRRVVCHPQIIGEPFALALNANLLKQLATDKSNLPWCEPELVGGCFANWLSLHDIDPKHVQPAGKNFASFDAQFLKRLPKFSDSIRFKHRTIDPAMLYWRPEDEQLPDSLTCMKRSGRTGAVSHTAVEDALDVIAEVRYAVGQKFWNFS